MFSFYLRNIWLYCLRKPLELYELFHTNSASFLEFEIPTDSYTVYGQIFLHVEQNKESFKFGMI